MSPSNRTRTLGLLRSAHAPRVGGVAPKPRTTIRSRETTVSRSLTFLAFASLAALTGCGSEPAAERTIAEQLEATRIAPVEALDLAAPSDATVPSSHVLRAPTAQLADEVSVGPIAALSPEITGQQERAGQLVLGSPEATSEPSVDYQRAGMIFVTSPARRAMECGPLTHTFTHAPSLTTLVVGSDACETDEDCVPDGCHATSCVAASEMAPGDFECTADLRYGTTDGGGCLCHVGHCAAVLSTPPQGI